MVFANTTVVSPTYFEGQDEQRRIKSLQSPASPLNATKSVTHWTFKGNHPSKTLSKDLFLFILGLTHTV